MRISQEARRLADIFRHKGQVLVPEHEFDDFECLLNGDGIEYRSCWNRATDDAVLIYWSKGHQPDDMQTYYVHNGIITDAVPSK